MQPVPTVGWNVVRVIPEVPLDTLLYFKKGAKESNQTTGPNGRFIEGRGEKRIETGP